MFIVSSPVASLNIMEISSLQSKHGEAKSTYTPSALCSIRELDVCDRWYVMLRRYTYANPKYTEEITIAGGYLPL